MIEYIRGHWDNGQLKYEELHKNGKLHGISKTWFANGQLEDEYPYHEGELHGVVKRWYEDGQLHHETSFQEDKRHGVTRWWYRDGKLGGTAYYLYYEEVTEKEFRKHELIKGLAGL